MRLLALACLAGALAARAQDVETIHVVPGSHLDIGFTDTPERVREKRVRVLDEAIDAAQQDPDFRWHEEGGWVVHAWRTAHREDRARLELLRALLKEGRITLGAAWASPHAAMFAGHLDLLFFHLDDFEKDLGVRPAAAVLNDVPSFPVALVDACARARVRYLLLGANMAFSPPLPAGFARTPFWWESPSGNRVLVYLDDDSYTAAYMKWGLDPDTARFFNPESFPRDRGALETMQAGVGGMLKRVGAGRDAAIVQHAFDNWDCGSAKKLPGFLKEWREGGKGPRIVAGGPEAYFRHIEEKYGRELPVRRGEWGGQWDAVRAAAPVWTWRLRGAMAALKADAGFEAKAALATAMEHSQGLGGGWPGMFTEEQTREHAAQVAALFETAVTLAAGAEAARARPQPVNPPVCDETCKEVWMQYLGMAQPRIRAGRGWLGPFTFDQSPELRVESPYGFNSVEYGTRIRFDRSVLKGSEDGDLTVVVEFLLSAPREQLAIAPEDSPEAKAGRWLLGAPPAFVVAPAGLRVSGLPRPLRVTAPLINAWCLVPDREKKNRTWLQGLLLRQSFRCELKDKSLKVLPFADLYPGEPAEVGAVVRMEILEE